MSCPKKNRRSKARRRRSYEDAVQRKLNRMSGRLVGAIQKMHEAVEEARRVTHSYDMLKAATDYLLKDRLVVDTARHIANDNARVEYKHPGMVHPVDCFKTMAIFLSKDVPPYECGMPKAVKVDQFRIGAHAFVDLFWQNNPQIMMMVQECTDHLGKQIGRLILQNMISQASESASRIRGYSSHA